MPIETELKLRIAPEHMQRLKRHPWLRQLASARARSIKLYSIYYDTAELDLQQHAMALRLRRSGRQYLQTLKGGGQANAGLHQRNEWETAVAAEQLDFDALKACGGTLPPGVHSRLQPVFITDFTRSLRVLQYDGAIIELCMDSGEIRAGQANAPISELELELKSGSAQQLFKLALALLEIVPLQIEQVSKAEYGYRLYSGVSLTPVRGRFPALKRSQEIAPALCSLLDACLTHVQANVPGVLLGRDPEFLHQVRVGLRRLRVLLALMLRWRNDPDLAALRARAGALCSALGRSRDWDVFVTQALMPVCAELRGHAGLSELLRYAETERARLQAGMADILESCEYSCLILNLGMWRQGVQATAGEPALANFALRLLKKRGQMVVNLGSILDSADAEQLHELRIACKKLRYSAEMFASLFGPGSMGGYIEHLSSLQEVLGALHDIAVARQILGTLDNVASRDTLEPIHARLEQHRAGCLAEFGRAWERYAAQPAFWN